MHIAYLAGLLDGEGSIMLSTQGANRARTPHIAISLSDARVIEEVNREFGGYVRTAKRGSSRKDMHTWNLKGFKAIDLLEKLRPHLVIERRRALADLLINDPVVRSTNRGPGSSKARNNEMLYQRMRTLNSKRLESPPEVKAKRPSSADIAYLAGILDGQGHITKKLRIEVSSTDPELLAWLKSRFGGGVYLQQEGKGARRTTWRWIRPPTGFKWAARVAAHMLIEHKRESVKKAQGFKRTLPPRPAGGLTENDYRYFDLRNQGLLIAAAARESEVGISRALRLEKIRPGG